MLFGEMGLADLPVDYCELKNQYEFCQIFKGGVLVSAGVRGMKTMVLCVVVLQSTEYDVHKCILP